MTLTSYAIENPDGFVALVKKLRAAGVVKLGALVLGPEPHAAIERAAVSPEDTARRRHEVMFAASSIRPAFATPVASTAGAPRAVVQRRERDEARGGEKHQG